MLGLGFKLFFIDFELEGEMLSKLPKLAANFKLTRKPKKWVFSHIENPVCTKVTYRTVVYNFGIHATS